MELASCFHTICLANLSIRKYFHHLFLKLSGDWCSTTSQNVNMGSIMIFRRWVLSQENCHWGYDPETRIDVIGQSNDVNLTHIRCVTGYETMVSRNRTKSNLGTMIMFNDISQ